MTIANLVINSLELLILVCLAIGGLVALVKVRAALRQAAQRKVAAAAKLGSLTPEQMQKLRTAFGVGEPK